MAKRNNNGKNWNSRGGARGLRLKGLGPESAPVDGMGQ